MLDTKVSKEQLLLLLTTWFDGLLSGLALTACGQRDSRKSQNAQRIGREGRRVSLTAERTETCIYREMILLFLRRVTAYVRTVPYPSSVCRGARKADHRRPAANTKSSCSLLSVSPCDFSHLYVVCGSRQPQLTKPESTGGHFP